MELNKLTPRQALIYDALIPPGMPVRGKELARRTRISERDLRSERKAMQEQGMKLDYVVEIDLPRNIARDRIMGRRVCKNDGNHPNNIFIDAIKPNGDKCRVCGGELSTRSDDQDEAAINKRHDIYYNTENGTLAAAYFFKNLAAEGKTKYIELNGEGTIDSIKETLISQLS